jgi:RNA polymerase sigma-70 factor (ECF subfamily)
MTCASSGPSRPGTPRALPSALVDLDDLVRQRVAAGDADGAATAAVNALGPPILGYLRALHAEDDAEDVFQQWAEDLWRGLAGFRGECTLRTWAYRLAWHASSRFRRQPWEKRVTRLPTSAASRLAQSVALSVARAGGDERLELLRRELEPEDRTLLLLRLDLEMPWEEVCTVLAREGNTTTPEALRKRYQRLKDRLGRLAREKGLLG